MSESVVYFIQNTENLRIKIGRTKDLGKRLSSLQVGSSAPLSIIGHIKGGAVEESILHERFFGSRILGEWFDGRIAPRVLSIIKEQNQSRDLEFLNDIETQFVNLKELILSSMDETQSFTRDMLNTMAIDISKPLAIIELIRTAKDFNPERLRGKDA